MSFLKNLKGLKGLARPGRAGPGGLADLGSKSLSNTWMGKKKMQKMIQNMTESLFGQYGEVAICNIKTVYTWAVFLALFLVAWMRGLLVLNKAFRLHIMALEPAIDPSSNAKTGRMVSLGRRASRFVLFAILFLTVMSLLLFFGVTVMFVWGVLQLIELLAESMPDAVWFFAEVLRGVFGSDTFFGALNPRHFKVHCIVLMSMITTCFLYAYVYFREADLMSATYLRDKFIRCVAILPLIAIVLYVVYMLYLIIITCF
jgi:hypothetical protein